MPIYAFECTACGHQFDRLQKMSDPDPDACPECAAGAIKRQLTAPAFRLSGSGWYETDFKKDGEKKRNLAEGGDGSGKPASDAGAKSGAGAAAAKEGSGSDGAVKPAKAMPPASPPASGV